MRVLLSDRTGEVPERVKADLERRLGELGRHFDLAAEADVELDRDLRRSGRPLQVVEITVRMVAPHLEPVRAREAGRDLGEVIGLALEKVDRELLRLKEQVRSHPLRVGHA